MTELDRSGRRIALAAVAGAHGVSGQVRLKLFTDDIARLKSYTDLYVAGVPRRLLEARASGAMAVATFEGISDRNDAEAVRGALVEIDRSALPPLQEGEYYHADLIGLTAFDRSGKMVGMVVAVENYGAGDLLEIELANSRRSLIPFRPGIADQEEDRVVIDCEFLA